MKILQEGKAAPAFQAPDQSGAIIRSKDFKGSFVVLYFYPKDDTPGCTKEACDFSSLSKKFEKKGALIFGVSRDSVEKHAKFHKKYNLTFPLLSDESGKITENYGVWKEKSMYGRKYMGIERTTFVINPQGKIAKIFPKVSVTGHAETLLKTIDELAEE